MECGLICHLALEQLVFLTPHKQVRAHLELWMLLLYGHMPFSESGTLTDDSFLPQSSDLCDWECDTV